MTRSRPAFTLLELLLVLAILVMLGAIAYPSLDAMYSGYRVKAAADQVRGAWATARARAVEEGRAYRFAVLPGKGNFRVAPDSADFWGGSGAAPDAASATSPPYVQDGALPKGVRFAGADGQYDLGDSGDDSSAPAGEVDPSQLVRWIVFLPDGTARTFGGMGDDNIEVVLSSPGTRPVTLRLRGLTGIVTVRQPSPQ